MQSGSSDRHSRHPVHREQCDTQPIESSATLNPSTAVRRPVHREQVTCERCQPGHCALHFTYPPAWCTANSLCLTECNERRTPDITVTTASLPMIESKRNELELKGLFAFFSSLLGILSILILQNVPFQGQTGRADRWARPSALPLQKFFGQIGSSLGSCPMRSWTTKTT